MESTRRKLLGIAALAVLVTLVVAPTTLRADDPGAPGRLGAIQGRAVDPYRNPVPNAIAVLWTRAGEPIARAETGRGGFFGFRGVAPGQYVVTVSHERVGAGRAQVGVRPGGVSHVTVVLY